MRCNNCGKMVPDDSNFCVYCGSPVAKSQTPPPLPIEDPKLSPAESLIIVNELAGFSDLVKLTIVDMVARKIISIKEKEQVTKFFKKRWVREVPFISRGENFSKYQLKPHEQVIIDCFQPDEQETLLSNFLYRLRPVRFNYEDDFLKTPLTEKGYFTVEQKRFLRIIKYKKWTLTEKGLAAKKKIEEFVEQSKNNLPNWVNNDPMKAANYVAWAGRSLLLLYAFDVGLDDIKRWFESARLDEVDIDYTHYGFSSHPAVDSYDSDLDVDFDPGSADFDPGDLASMDMDFDLDFDFDFDFDFDSIDFDVGDGGDVGDIGGD